MATALARVSCGSSPTHVLMLSQRDRDETRSVGAFGFRLFLQALPMPYKISRKVRTQYWNYKIIKCHPGLHNGLCNFHAFQYSTVRASKYDTVALTPQQKG